MKYIYTVTLYLIFPFLYTNLFAQQLPPVPEWQSIPGISGQFNALAATSDGGMVAVGYTYGALGNADSSAALGFHHQAGNQGYYYDAWVVKFSSAGQVEWGHCYGGDDGNEFANSVCVAPDGGYVVAGSAESDDGDLTHNAGGTDFWVFKVNSSGKLQWSKSYGGYNTEAANGVINTLDGGFIASGVSVYTGWVFKLNAQGDSVWSKFYGGDNGHNSVQNAIQNADSGFTFGAISSASDGDLTGDSNTTTDLHYWLFTTDKVGTIKSQKVPYPSIVSNQYIENFIRCKDKGYALVGYSQPVIDNVVYFPEIYVMRTDSTGKYLWSKNYGSSGYDFGYCVVQDTDGNLIVGGYLEADDTDFPQHTSTAFLLKLDENNGSQVWYQHYPAEPYHGTTDGASSFQDLKWASDGGLLAAGEFVKGQWKIDSLLTPGAIRPGYGVKFPPPGIVTTGIKTIGFKNNSFSVYPNPVEDQLHLKFSSLVSFPVEVEINSDLGQVMIQQKIFSTAQTISVNHLPAGAYTCKVIDNDGYEAGVLFEK